jgi:uncharacterized membrane protein YjdF
MNGIALKCKNKESGQIWEVIIEWPSLELQAVYTLTEEGLRHQVESNSFSFDHHAFDIIEVRIDPLGSSRQWVDEVRQYFQSLYEATSPTLFMIAKRELSSSSMSPNF